MNARLQALGTKILNGGAASTVFNIFLGRFTFAALVFSAIGIYGWLHLNRDLTSYALFVGAVQSLLAVHSAKEDYFDLKNRQIDVQQTTIQNNITIDPNAPQAT
jgi:hypothetical protein